MRVMNTTDRDQCRRQEEIEARQRERARAAARCVAEDLDRQRLISLMILVGDRRPLVTA